MKYLIGVKDFLKKLLMLDKLLNKYSSFNIALKSGFWFAVVSILQRGINFILLPIFTRVMTLEEFGTVSLYNSWLSLISLFVTLNIAGTIYNVALTKYKNQNNIVFLSSMLITIGITIVFIFLLNISSFDITQLGKELNIFLLLQTMTVIPFSFWLAESRYKYEYKIAVKFIFAQTVISVIISLLSLNFFDNKVLGYISGPIISNMIFSIVIFKNYHFKKINILKLRVVFKFIIMFGLGTLIHYLGSILLVHADRIIIEKFLTKSEVAIYSVGYSFGMILMLIPTAVGQSFSPWFYKTLSSGKQDEIFIVLNKITGLSLILIMLFISLSGLIVTNLFDERYFESISTVNIIASSIYYILVYTLIANFQFYFEKKLLISLSTILAALINIVLNFIFVPKYGFISASFTSLFSYLLLCFIHVFLAKSICKTKFMPFNFNWVLVLFLPSFFLTMFLLVEDLDETYKFLYRFLLIIAFSIFYFKTNNLTLKSRFF